MKNQSSEPVDSLLHEEELPFALIRYVELLFWGLVILFLSLIYYQVMFAPSGAQSAQTLIYLLMAIVMAATAFLMHNFKMLRVRITDTLLELSFGMFHRRIKWSDITCISNDRLTWLRYGGWGIRLTRANGTWRWVYNVIGPERVVVHLKSGRIRDVAFSTNQPGRVIALIQAKSGCRP